MVSSAIKNSISARGFGFEASAETLELGHYLIRKCAHFTEYFLFSLLVLRAFTAGRPGPNLKWTLWTVVVVFCYASFDEFHQSFVPGRTALFTDVLIDSTGGIVAQIVAWVWMTWRKARGSGGSRELVQDPMKH